MGVQGDISFLPLAGSVLSLIKDGKLRALGMAQAERNPLAPNIPTLGEIDPQLKRFDYPTWAGRSEEHTSELQSLMRISYAVFCLKKKINKQQLIHQMTATYTQKRLKTSTKTIHRIHT